jgi:hypothetical protein
MLLLGIFMDPITTSIITGILANACYSVFQQSSVFLKDKIKEKILLDMEDKSLNIPSAEKLDPILDKLALLDIDEDSSPKKIAKEIAGDSELVSRLEYLEKVCTNNTQSVSKTVNINNSGLMQFGDINQ